MAWDGARWMGEWKMEPPIDDRHYQADLIIIVCCDSQFYLVLVRMHAYFLRQCILHAI